MTLGPRGPAGGVGNPAGAEPSASPASVTRTALSLGGVLAIIVTLGLGGRWLAKRTGFAAGGLAGRAPSPQGVLEVLGRYPLQPGATLLLLKLDRKILLVSQTGGRGLRSAGNLSTLCEVSEPEDVASILIRIRGEEQSRLAAKFEAMLSQEDAAFEEERPAPKRQPSRRQPAIKDAPVARLGPPAPTRQGVEVLRQRLATRPVPVPDPRVKGATPRSGVRSGLVA